MYENNTIFFFFWKIICCNGHNQSTNPEQLSPYEDSDEEITTRLFSKDYFCNRVLST